MHLLYKFIQNQESAYAARKHSFLAGFGYVTSYRGVAYHVFSISFSV